MLHVQIPSLVPTTTVPASTGALRAVRRLSAALSPTSVAAFWSGAPSPDPVSAPEVNVNTSISVVQTGHSGSPKREDSLVTAHSTTSMHGATMRTWVPFFTLSSAALSGVSTVFGNSTNSPAPSSSVLLPQMPVLLLNGKEGSGRTSVVVWARAQATNRKIPVVSCKLTKRDAHKEHHLLRKLFTQLMPKDLFIDAATQRTHICILLRKLYPGSPLLAEHIGYPALKTALGITCSYTEESSSPDNSPKKPLLLKGSRSLSLSGFLLKATEIPNIPIHDTLVKIFSYLFTIQPILIIVEHIENSDEESLRVLNDCIKLPTKAGLLLSALLMNEKKKKVHLSSILLPKSYEKDAFKASLWTRQIHTQIQKHRSTTTLTLETYTLTEIEVMLATALEGSGRNNNTAGTIATPEMAALVQEFAGGSCFWVREIMRCIKENGRETFMTVLEAARQDTTGSAATPTAGTSTAAAVAAHIEQEYEESRRYTRRRSSISMMRGSMRLTSFAASVVAPASTASGAGASMRVSVRPQFTRGISSAVLSTGTQSQQLQLDKLVLCRFNNLSLDAQRTLRTASVIGLTFTGTLLYNVLPKYLQTHMQVSMDVLLSQKWLYEDTEIPELLQFSHPHAHKIIYQLTPSSERNILHQTIATAMEVELQNKPDDRTQYMALSYHYQYCNSDKAVYYAVQAALVLLDSITVIYDFGEIVELLVATLPSCKTHYDCEVLLMLVARTSMAIEMCDAYAEQKTDSTQGWVSMLYTFLRGISTISSRTSFSTSSSGKSSRMSSIKYSTKNSTKVIPTNNNNNTQDNNINTVQKQNNLSVRGFDNIEAEQEQIQNEDDDGAETDNVTVNCRQHTKRTFCKQLRQLREQLCQKQSSFCLFNGNVGKMEEPTQWQRELLELQA